ncbi:hypothetical protein Q9T70_002925, partial [Listeria monocytogenes]|nr:hypothetical protein [Listeria monocytogenes]
MVQRVVLEVKQRPIWLQKFYHAIAEINLYTMVQKMGYGEEEFFLFQRKRIVKSSFMMLAAIPLALTISKWLFLLAPVLFIYNWWNDYQKEKREFHHFIFLKNLDFAKFMRLVVPYLMQNNTSLYGVFNRMIKRLDEGEVKQLLRQLMIDMTNNPGTDEPFRTFAESAGDSEEAITFMVTLYDYSEYAKDDSVLKDLSELASNEILRGSDEIITIKSKRFAFFPTKLNMLSTLLLMGYMGSVAYG